MIVPAAEKQNRSVLGGWPTAPNDQRVAISFSAVIPGFVTMAPFRTACAETDVRAGVRLGCLQRPDLSIESIHEQGSFRNQDRHGPEKSYLGEILTRRIAE
jgi:hypothetical protein